MKNLDAWCCFLIIFFCAHLNAQYYPDHVPKKRSSMLLHRAASKGDTVQLALLIEQEEDLNAQDGHGNTPLHCAVLGGRVQAVQMLLNAGASVSQSDRFGRIPIEYTDDPEMIRLLSQRDPKFEALKEEFIIAGVSTVILFSIVYVMPRIVRVLGY